MAALEEPGARMSAESDREALEKSLERISAALGTSAETPSTKEKPPDPVAQQLTGIRRGSQGALGVALLLMVVAVASGHFWLLAPAFLLGVIAGAMLIGGVGE